MNEVAPIEGGKRGRRGGGRSANARGRGPAIKQLPWQKLVNNDRPTEPLPPEGVEAIHDGAMRILEEIGIEVLNPQAIEILKGAGATVEGELVRIGRDAVMEHVRKAPSQFTITPRNPDREITVGGKHILFGNVSSAP
ncbi:MAG: trimethylamine methyltransferase family protein, partial [Pseudomonadota bacterium]